MSEVLQTMLVTKLKMAAVAVVGVVLLGVGGLAGLQAYQPSTGTAERRRLAEVALEPTREALKQAEAEVARLEALAKEREKKRITGAVDKLVEAKGGVRDGEPAAEGGRGR